MSGEPPVIEKAVPCPSLISSLGASFGGCKSRISLAFLLIPPNYDHRSPRWLRPSPALVLAALEGPRRRQNAHCRAIPDSCARHSGQCTPVVLQHAASLTTSPGSQFALHSILSFTHEGYGEATSLSNIASKIPWGNKEYPIPGADIAVGGPVSSPTTGTNASPLERRANATILMLARNSDVDSAIRSVRELEDKFNSKFQYPWTFLNEEPFSDEFKTRVSNVISGPVEFGLIPHDHWFQPEWIDEAKATAGRDKMVQDNIIYGGSVSYRNMCRFNSGVRTFHLQP